MFEIRHSDAVALENQICRLFKCNRLGVSGLAHSSTFESHPMDAAIMVVSYIYAKGLQNNETQYSDFLTRYNTIFTYSDENNAKNEVKNYIKELTQIINKYV